MNARREQSGFTLVEMVIVATILPILFGAIYMVMAGVGHIQEQAGSTITSTEKLRSSLRRIADEVRTSSATGEDINDNARLDSGEDLNGNGRLESDWAITGESITFNRMQPDGTYSLPITYRLREGQLERIVTLDAQGQTQSAVICRSVAYFSVISAENRVTVDLAVDVDHRGGDAATRSAKITVVQRN